MPEGAPGGPGPEESGVEPTPAAAAEQSQQLPSLNEVPAPQRAEEPRRPWRWPWQRRPQSSAPAEIPAEDREQLEADQRQVERESGRFLSRERQERLARPRTPEDLVHFMSVVTAEQFRELKLNERHGAGRIAALRKFLAGERDFDLTEDGQIRSRGWRELARKALITVFNRKTALAAGTLGVIGILTGGVGLPAAGALFGAIAGRGAAEAWESIRGEERGLRAEIAQAHYDQWAQLRQLAIRAQDESLSDEERGEALRNLIEGFHQTSQGVREREEEIKEVQARWNKRRGMFSSIGAVAGFGLGFWAGFQGLSQMATRLDLDGNGIYHSVEKINGIWHFAYNSSGEAMAAQQAGARVFEQAGQFYHAVGPDAARIPAEIVKNLLPEAGRVAGVFAALGLGGFWTRRAEAGRAEDEEREEARRQRRTRESRERLMAQVPSPAETSAGGTPEPTSEEPTIPQQYVELARKAGKEILPQVGQIWLMDEIHPDTGKKYRVAYLIRNIDWANGRVMVNQLDSRNFTDILAENQSMDLKYLLRHGREITEDWLLAVKDGAEIEITEDMTIVDRSHPQAPKIEAGKYKFKRLEKKPDQAELIREGERMPIVEILDLAMAGVRPIAEKEESEAGEKVPKAGGGGGGGREKEKRG